MTAASGKFLPVGLRHARLFELDANGYPKATSTTVYEGLQIVGGQAFNVTIPEIRRITHTGDDRVQGRDTLPTQEGSTAELTAACGDLDVLALLTGVSVFTIAENKGIGWNTSRQGSEPQVGMLLYQQAIDPANNGARNWRAFILPRATAIPRPQGMSEQASTIPFSITPAICTKHLWGTAFSLANDGFTQADILERQFVYTPKIVAWKADGTEDEFLFPVDAPAVDTAKVAVWNNGVVASPTVTTTKLTFSPAPAANAMIVCMYEVA